MIRPEQFDSEKDGVWDEKAEEVENIVDGLGLGIDDGIKGAVVAFMVHGFPTTGSCEGHPEGEHGHAYPWIDVCVDEPEGWQDDKAKQDQWHTNNLEQRQRIEEFLKEFYDSRDGDGPRLSLKDKGVYGAFRIGGSDTKGMPLIEAKVKHAQYLDEMSAFVAFLKEKFLSA